MNFKAEEGAQRRLDRLPSTTFADHLKTCQMPQLNRSEPCSAELFPWQLAGPEWISFAVLNLC